MNPQADLAHRLEALQQQLLDAVASEDLDGLDRLLTERGALLLQLAGMPRPVSPELAQQLRAQHRALQRSVEARREQIGNALQESGQARQARRSYHRVATALTPTRSLIRNQTDYNRD